MNGKFKVETEIGELGRVVVELNIEKSKYDAEGGAAISFDAIRRGMVDITISDRGAMRMSTVDFIALIEAMGIIADIVDPPNKSAVDRFAPFLGQGIGMLLSRPKAEDDSERWRDSLKDDPKE